MHGYLPETQDNKPSFIVNSDKINHDLRGKKINDLDMKDIPYTKKSIRI